MVNFIDLSKNKLKLSLIFSIVSLVYFHTSLHFSFFLCDLGSVSSSLSKVWWYKLVELTFFFLFSFKHSQLQISLEAFSSVQFSCSVVSDSLQPYELQHARLPCRLTPRACSNSCPSNQWCHLTIPSSVIPFSSCLQSFPASGSFPMSQFFTSGDQSTGASASVSVLPMNISVIFFQYPTFNMLCLHFHISQIIV